MTTLQKINEYNDYKLLGVLKNIYKYINKFKKYVLTN
jgi:hypothetical protein